jgi:hypothetical protein
MDSQITLLASTSKRGSYHGHANEELDLVLLLICSNPPSPVGGKQMATIHRGRIFTNTPKFISIGALVSLAVLFGCNQRTRASSRNISASSDASGSHPSSAKITGPVMVTCVSAIDDTGTATPPACVVDAPGASGVVKIGDKVAVTGAGNVVLTCQGKGTLTCTAKIEE